MMFRVKGGTGLITYKLIKFSGGELQPRLECHIGKAEMVEIRADLTSSDSIMELVLLMDAIRRSGGTEATIHLTCPYLPYARQDRQCDNGEPLSLKAMCDIINSLNFATVTVWDVHSDVAMALLDRAFNVPQKHFLAKLNYTKNCVLVAPDAGAIKKTMESAKYLALPMVRADKIRSVHDGSITGTTVYSEHIGDKDFLVADDICDGGRTFLELGKVLRPLTNGKLFLYVTHGIFSKGITELLTVYDHIFTANPFPEANWTSTAYTILKG